MSNDNVLDQSEIERLLGGAGAAPPPPPAAPAPASPGGILDQSELDALFGGGATPAAPPSAPALDGMLDQSQIESLLGGVKPTSTSASTPPPGPAATGPPKNTGMGMIGGPFAGVDEPEDDEDGVQRSDIDYIHKRADESLRSIVDTKLGLPTEVIEFQYPEFGGAMPSNEHATLDQISEVELNVKIELGRTEMYIEDVLKLRKGSVVPLDKQAGDAVDIFVNGRLLARGEVLVMNDNFCVRVAELHAGAIPME